MQTANFRATFARSVAAYNIAQTADRIRVELEKQGKTPREMAFQLGAELKSGDNWVSGKSEIQRRYRKPIADYLGLEMEDLFPDLVLEEAQLRSQIDRIEYKLEQIAQALGLSFDEKIRGPRILDLVVEDAATAKEAAQAAQQAARESRTRRGGSAGTRNAKSKKRATG